MPYRQLIALDSSVHDLELSRNSYRIISASSSNWNLVVLVSLSLFQTYFFRSWGTTGFRAHETGHQSLCPKRSDLCVLYQARQVVVKPKRRDASLLSD